ncbi:MAG TPA: VOC family protein [Herpetosiphonaceae bacterium]
MNHPVVMFEIMADSQPTLIDFYTGVFGWQVQYNQSGFAYIHFPPATYHLLGGIGKAQPGTVGWEKGITFYIQVEDLQKTLEQVRAHGGTVAVEPVEADGYHFAMFYDPEHNLVGLILPFDTQTADTQGDNL